MDLHPDLTLIVGENGAGKTSVIDAIAIVLDGWLRAFPGASRRSIDRRRDVRQIPTEHQGIVTLESALPAMVSGRGSVGEQLYVHERVVGPDGTDAGREANPIAKEARARGLGREPVDLPLIARFGTERMRSGRPRKADALPEVVATDIAEGYRHCMHTTRSQGSLEAWMRWREQVRLQEISEALARGRKTDDVRSPHLDAVEAAVCACLPGAKAFRYDFTHQELRFSFEDGRHLPFRLLSGGYRNLLGLVADMAWRTVVLNPRHAADAPSRSEGVVLIDEIDLHLHPRWQRVVIGGLRSAFPRVQFVMTTHSPQVVSSAKGAWMRILDASGRVSKVDHTEGRDSNAILDDIFGAGARPEKTMSQIRSIFTAIDRGDYAEARRSLEALQGQVGEHDVDVVRARWLLEQEETA
jgi:predicted ATP-binding protein involved in virulence